MPKILLAAIVIFLSLLWFPSALPILAALLLAIASTFVFKHRVLAIIVLSFMVVVLLMKNVGVSWGWLLLVGTYSTTIIATAISKKRSPPMEPTARQARLPLTRLQTVCWLACWGATLCFWLDWHWAMNMARPLQIKPGKPVVCVGDSITAAGYPELLAQQLSVPVVNMGFDGIDSDDVLRMYPEIMAHDPQMIVVEIGGHDYNRGGFRSDTRNRIRRLIEQARRDGAETILMEIPRGFVTDPFYGVERELARVYDVQLIPDSTIRKFVLFSPIFPPGMWLGREWHLSNDGLHPNQRGNEQLAQDVLSTLRRLYGDEILAQ